MGSIIANITNISPLKRHVSWNVFGNIGGKLLAPFAQLIIARQLIPEDYGAFGIATALICLYDVVKDLGFTEAIIVGQSEEDINSQFTLQVITAFVMYILVVLLSPFFSIFYGDHRYMTVLPLMGIVFFIKAIIDPLTTLYLKTQKFKLLAIRQMVFPIVFGAVGFFFASIKFGVYSLVFGTVLANISVAVCLYLNRTQNFAFVWDVQVKRKLFKLGKHIILQRVAGYLVHYADSFTIGKILGILSLGVYKTAMFITNMIPNCVVGQTQQVLFTELSKQQINQEYVDRRYQHFVMHAGLFLLLYVIAISILSPLLVLTLMGEQWGNVVPFIQIFSAGVITGYIANINSDISRIMGFTYIYTRYAACRSVFTVVSVSAMSFISLKAAACAWVFTGIVGNIINEYLFHKYQNNIKISMAKILFYIISIIWFVFIVSAIYIKPKALFFIITA